ncbi:MAG: hypothetical protein GEU75_16990 [Dehalococcoidia bacterium]|nr:hypothetical protein [Dehalococcoidia bacterium]
MWLKRLRGFESMIRGKKLTATGRVQPLDITDEYLLELRYQIGERPHVFVIEPAIRRRDGERADHMYGDTEPCVYLPKNGEWSPDKLLAETLVPWTMLWLVFYEAWLVTGVWDGGGVHPLIPPGDGSRS